MTRKEKLPEKIGPYYIDALLDKGGMSTLYLARHPETKEPLAVKVLSQKYISNPEVIQRFLNEAEIISMTNHPNIVKMYGHGAWEGGLFIAMEYIEGTTLRRYLQTTPLSLKKSLSIIVDIAYALCHLHTHGVIHRDLKPENILVTEDGSIKVIDFGIAQLLTQKLDPTGPPKQQLIGTPIYISPEQKENPETVSYPSDIYSLGIVAYELILNKLSHGHIHLSLMPRGLQPILTKCLKPNPNERYQDIVDFITDTTDYLNSPTLEKDQAPTNKIGELSEDLKQVQEVLIPIQAPLWNGIDIGAANYKGLSQEVVYYDFFTMEDGRKCFIMGETSSKGVEGSVTVANFRGMVRSLLPFANNPVELVTVLNDLLTKDNLGPIYNFNCLMFDNTSQTINTLSCGSKSLWILKQDGEANEADVTVYPSLGVDRSIQFEEDTLEWGSGDLFMLNTFAPVPPKKDGTWNFSPDYYLEAIKESYKLPAQKMVDHILRKLRLTAGESIKNRSLTLIAFRRD